MGRTVSAPRGADHGCLRHAATVRDRPLRVHSCHGKPPACDAAHRHPPCDGGSGEANHGACHRHDCSLPIHPPSRQPCGDAGFGEDPIVWDRSLSIAALSKLPTQSRRAGAGLEGYDHSLGLTEAEVSARAGLEMESVPQVNGGYCTVATSAAALIQRRVHPALFADSGAVG